MKGNNIKSISETIDNIRAGLIDTMLGILLIVCIPALAASLYRMNSTGWHGVMAFQVIAFIYLTVS